MKQTHETQALNKFKHKNLPFYFSKKSLLLTLFLLVILLNTVLDIFTINKRTTSKVNAATIGTTYYIDNVNGADSNNGLSDTTAWSSLNKVNSFNFSAGDTISFKRGEIWTGQLAIQNSGTSGAPITVTAYGDSTLVKPTITNPGATGSNTKGIVVNANWVTIDNMEVNNVAEAGLYIGNGYTNVTLQNNEVLNAGFGITVFGQSNLITHNYLHDLHMIVNTPCLNGSGCNDDYGAVAIVLYNSSNEVSYNTIVNARAQSYDYGYDGGAIEIYAPSGLNVNNNYVHHNWSNNTEGFLESGGVSGQVSDNTEVSYNIITNSHGGMCFHRTGTFGISMTNFYFYNNTIVNNTTNSPPETLIIDCDAASMGTLYIKNNIFYIRDYNYIASGTISFIHENNIYNLINTVLGYSLGTGEKEVDPLFVDLANTNFHLTAASPAIDAGQNLGLTPDYDGNPVPFGNATDIGVYEYGYSNSITPTSATTPTNLPTPSPVPPTVTPSPTITPSPVNLLQNGSFETGISPWALKLTYPVQASVTRDGTTSTNGKYSARISIQKSTSSTPYYIQFRYNSLSMTPGKSYQLTFWAKSSSNRTITASLQGQNSPYNMYLSQNVSLTNSWKKFSFTYNATVSDTIFLGFNLAASSQTVWIDNVTLLSN